MLDRGLRFRDRLQHLLSQLQHRVFARIADVDRADFVILVHHQHHAANQIVGVTERSCLRPFAVDGDRLASQRLRDEVRDHAAVVRIHARAIRVEDANDPHLQLVLVVIVHAERLGDALPLVVTASRSDRVDVPPIVLRLRMDRRVSVNFRRGGMEHARLAALRQPQHVDDADRRGLDRLDRVVLVGHG